MNPAPTSVVLVFALSEQGRRDAFRKGHTIQADGENGGHFLQTFSLESDSDPELFERALSLDFYLSDDCETFEIPVRCRYSFYSDSWTLGGPTPFCDGNFGNPTRVIKEAPSQLLFGPVAFADPDIAELGLCEVLGANPQEVCDFFMGLDYYPTVEELLDEAEQARMDALAIAIPVEEAIATLAKQYETYVELLQDLLLHQFCSWESRHAAGVLSVDRLEHYEKQLLDISVESGYAEIRRIVIDGPVQLVGELAAASEQLILQAALDWCEANGSARLKRIAAEGFLESSMAVYRDERLVFERPGWGWIPTAQEVSLRNPVAPGEDEFALLDAAREVSPEAKLHYATLGKGSGCFVAVDSFLGRQIWFPGDALAELEAAGK
jgi:hypothetical protein